MTTRQAGVCWRASHFTRAVRLGQTPHARCAPRTPPQKRCQAGTAPASPIRRRMTQTASVGRIKFVEHAVAQGRVTATHRQTLSRTRIDIRPNHTYSLNPSERNGGYRPKECICRELE